MFRDFAKINCNSPQNLTFCRFLLVFLLGCQQFTSTEAPAPALEAETIALKARYAPDRRTDRVEVGITQQGDSALLTGYTTVPAALGALDSLAAARTRTYSEVRLLPREEKFGLIRVSVANIRTEAGHSQELTSQALLGTPVEILDEADGWYMIRTPDRYIAWLETGAVTPASPAELAAWFGDSLYVAITPQSSVYTDRKQDALVSELVAGDLLRADGPATGGLLPVRLPDGRTGYAPSGDVVPYSWLTSPTEVIVEDVLSTAFEQVGRPYLWGGTSTKAMDCSGFTKTAYYLNGFVIPRDASQQVHAGTEIPLDDAFAELRRGDLLFFGNFRDDGSERVTHVGFYLGEGRFLHAGADNGYITENSLLESDPDFAPHRRESLLRARRLVAGTAGVVPIESAFASLYTRSSSR